VGDGSVGALRGALGVVVPGLADERIVLGPQIPGNPRAYWRGAARVGEGHVAKFAWSAEAAARLEHELTVMPLLRELAPSVPLPEIVASSRDPLLLVTRSVPGVPCAGPPLDRGATDTIPVQLAEALAALHAPAVRDGLTASPDITLGDPEPQSRTQDLRQRVAGAIVTGERARRVRTWCDWIDDLQGGPAPDPVVVHGDLHGHNLVISEDGERLRLVADLEEVALGDPHYDLRYLVSIRSDLAWFAACCTAYERASGRRLDVERILAWHVLTALGDAMWRTELGVPLPGGMTPDGSVDDITWRMAELGIAP
jgi:aminoglycoside phosphotransferase (APT) family kinase protein